MLRFSRSGKGAFRVFLNAQARALPTGCHFLIKTRYQVERLEVAVSNLLDLVGEDGVPKPRRKKRRKKGIGRRKRTRCPSGSGGSGGSEGEGREENDLVPAVVVEWLQKIHTRFEHQPKGPRNNGNADDLNAENDQEGTEETTNVVAISEKQRGRGGQRKRSAKLIPCLALPPLSLLPPHLHRSFHLLSPCQTCLLRVCFCFPTDSRSRWFQDGIISALHPFPFLFGSIIISSPHPHSSTVPSPSSKPKQKALTFLSQLGSRHCPFKKQGTQVFWFYLLLISSFCR